MPKLIVFNNLSDSKNVSGVKQAAFERSIWFAEKDDVVVASTPISKKYFEYVGDILGFDAKTVQVVSPVDSNSNLITDKDLIGTSLIEQLRPMISQFQAWEVMPCFYTPGIVQLCEALSIKPPAGSGFASQGGLDLVNRKIQFRRLASSIDLPLAEGCVVYDSPSLSREIKNHLSRTGSVIIKKDYAYGGLGNVGVTSKDIGNLSGVRQTFVIDENVDSVADKVTGILGEALSEGLVIESYYPSLHQLYFEYYIGENAQASFLNSGSIRVSESAQSKQLLWFGLDLPPEGVPTFSYASALADSMRFATLSAQIGYRGYINIDAVINYEGKIIFNESNGRWGGCTVLHKIAERLFGRNYGDKVFLSSNRKVKGPQFAECLSILKDSRLQFDSSKTEGVLLLASSERPENNLECLFIAPTRERIRELETKALLALQR